MKKNRLGILLAISLSVLSLPSDATRYMGSDISWRCIGQDSYMIKLTILRDCNGAYLPGTINVNLKCDPSGYTLTALSLTQGSPVDITPICGNTCTRCTSYSCSFPYGIQKYEYQGLAVLTSAGSCCLIKMTIDECCRFNSITTGAASQVFHTEALLNRCQNPCDNSPEFSNYPSIICVGQDFVFNSNLTDIDSSSSGQPLDSFAWELASPMTSSTSYTTWVSGYSYDKPVYFFGFPNTTLPFPRGFHLDPVTGNLSFRPFLIEQTIMCLKVSEFRNGVKIGEVRREIFIIVINCPNNHPPSLKPAVFYKEVCPYDTVTFTVLTDDLDTNDNLTISYSGNIPGATWSDSNGLSKHPTGTFTWIPTENQFSNIPYRFTVTVSDEACPVTGKYSHAYQVLVKQKPGATITVSKSCQGNYFLDANSLSGSSASYIWKRDVAPDKFNMPGKFIFHQFSQPGIYPFTMTVTQNLCSTTYTDTVVVDTFLMASLPSDTHVCKNTMLRIVPAWWGSQGLVRFSWSTSPSDTLDHLQFLADKDTTISVSISDNSPCIIKKEIKVTVFPLPPVNAGADRKACPGDTVILRVTGGNHYLWSTGDSDSVIVTMLVLSDTFTVTAWNDNGCIQKDTVHVSVLPLPTIDVIQDTGICNGNSAILYASGGSNCTWSTGDTTSSIHVTPSVTAYYYVTARDTNGCKNTDSVFVDVYPLPVVRFSAFPVSGLIPLAVNFHDSSSVSSGTVTGYFWEFGNGDYSFQKDTIYTYTDTGSFDVSLTVVTDKLCFSRLVKQKMITTSRVSIPEPNSNSDIEIFPNPAKDYVLVRLVNEKIAEAVLFDYLGKKIRNLQDINRDELTLLKPSNGGGIYILKIKTMNGNLFTAKILFE